MNNLCVYCGSKPGKSYQYALMAICLAEELVKRNVTLIYGGSSSGIMGFLAKTVLELKGKAVGIVPKFFLKNGIICQNLTELYIVSSMNRRKSLMIEMADAFAVLPGGIGTLEEIFETWVQAQLALHKKPIGFLNVEGYYDHLIKFIDSMKNEQFIATEHHSMIFFEKDPIFLINRLQ